MTISAVRGIFYVMTQMTPCAYFVHCSRDLENSVCELSTDICRGTVNFVNIDLVKTTFLLGA
jgi:hypothetical protein